MYRRNTETTEAGGRIPTNEPAPETVAECLIDDRKFKPAAANAIREFRASKPWRGDVQERFDKLNNLHDLLCVVYGITTELRLIPLADAPQGYDPESNVIALAPDLSVVSYLYCFAMATGFGPAGARSWGFGAFRRFFPNSYARLVPIGNVLVSQATAAELRIHEAAASDDPTESEGGDAFQSLLDMFRRRGNSMN